MGVVQNIATGVQPLSGEIGLQSMGGEMEFRKVEYQGLEEGRGGKLAGAGCCGSRHPPLPPALKDQVTARFFRLGPYGITRAWWRGLPIGGYFGFSWHSGRRSGTGFFRFSSGNSGCGRCGFAGFTKTGRWGRASSWTNGRREEVDDVLPEVHLRRRNGDKDGGGNPGSTPRGLGPRPPPERRSPSSTTRSG